jgi:hypothetical protein
MSCPVCGSAYGTELAGQAPKEAANDWQSRIVIAAVAFSILCPLSFYAFFRGLKRLKPMQEDMALGCLALLFGVVVILILVYFILGKGFPGELPEP